MAVLHISDPPCGHVIEPDLFGFNMEVTRQTFWHGLSAQMLANRKFFAAEGGTPLAWKIAGDIRWQQEKECAFLVFDGNGEICQICQDTVLNEGEFYQISFLVEAQGDFEVIVRLNEEIYYRRSVYSSEQAEEFSFRVKAKTPLSDPVFHLQVKGTGQLKLHAVSVLPDNHYFGMRRDVLEKLRTLAPSALRFPGGCYAECYPWKSGLLPPNRRPVIHTDLYQGDFLLRHTFSQDCFEMNIDEFMSMCDYVGAKPELTLPLIRQPLQDAIDLVEYCRGGADTEWGALRVKRGHPEPYPVEEWYIGNEIYYFGGELAEHGELAADKTIKMAEEIKKIDPECRLVLGFCPHNPEWSRTYLSKAGYLADKLSIHFYQTNEMDKNYQKVTAEMRNSVLEDFFIPELSRAKKLAEEIECGHIPFSLDEWGYNWGEPGSPESMLVDSRLMAYLENHAEEWNIAKALYFHPVNEGMILVNSHKAEWDYFGAAFQMFSALRGKQKLDITEQDQVYTVAGKINRNTIGAILVAYDREAACPIRFESDLFSRSSSVRLFQIVPDEKHYYISKTEGSAGETFTLYAGAVAFAEIITE